MAPFRNFGIAKGLNRKYSHVKVSGVNHSGCSGVSGMGASVFVGLHNLAIALF